jgi:hypothetical protein
MDSQVEFQTAPARDRIGGNLKRGSQVQRGRFLTARETRQG